MGNLVAALPKLLFNSWRQPVDVSPYYAYLHERCSTTMVTMTADTTLIAFLIIFWGLIWASIKVGNLVSGKRFSDGPSLIPLLPVLSLSMLGIGILINLFVSPWGTVCVVAVHLGWIIVTTLISFIKSHTRKGKEQSL